MFLYRALALTFRPHSALFSAQVQQKRLTIAPVFHSGFFFYLPFHIRDRAVLDYLTCQICQCAALCPYKNPAISISAHHRKLLQCILRSWSQTPRRKKKGDCKFGISALRFSVSVSLKMQTDIQDTGWVTLFRDHSSLQMYVFKAYQPHECVNIRHPQLPRQTPRKSQDGWIKSPLDVCMRHSSVYHVKIGQHIWLQLRCARLDEKTRTAEWSDAIKICLCEACDVCVQ